MLHLGDGYSVRAAFAACVGALLLALGAGCEGEYVSATGVSPERTYADALLVPASELGADWTEAGRAVAARTRFGGLDASWAGTPPSVVPADILATLKPDGPLAIWATVAYESEAARDGVPVRLVATYMYRTYPPLPLGEETELPPGLVAEWVRGADGLALGWKSDSADATATSGEEAGTGGAAAVPPDEEGDGEDRAETEPADSDAPDAPVFQPAVGASTARASDPDGVVESDATSDLDTEPGDAPSGRSETVDAQGEAMDAEAGASLVDGADDGEDAQAQSASAAKTGPQPEPGPTVYLAADGVTIVIRATANVEDEALETAVEAIRSRMARALEAEKRMREDIAAIRESRAEAVRVEKKANPEANAYWNLLEKASGRLVRIEY